MSERLTTDNPTNNLETIMNYCSDKDGAAMLSYADGEENVNLCEYTAKCCIEKGCEIDAADVLEDGLTDCTNCPIAIMYYLGVQAVELRARLKHYEDINPDPKEIMDMIESMSVKLIRYQHLAEQGRLVELPCAVGDVIYDVCYADIPSESDIAESVVQDISTKSIMFGDDWCDSGLIGKTIFLSREDAENELRKYIKETVK